MLAYYKNDVQGLVQTDVLEEDCWIHLWAPTEEELARVEKATGVLPEFLRAALDEEERSRIESDEDQTLVLVDIPRVELDGKNYLYSTLPMAIIHLPDYVITVSLMESSLVRDMVEGRVRGVETHKKTRLILQLLYRNATRYLWYLRQIDQASNRVQTELQRSYRNKELLQMMALEKSLVYFSTSLMSNEAVLERLVKVSYIKKYPDDEELLNDVIIENKQAIEMCAIFRDILSGTMDAYASIISNNLNIVMKFLAAVTIILSVPTLITGAFGMNVGGMPFSGQVHGFWIVTGIALVVSLVSGAIMWKKKMF
jgi:magnesium transporter